MPLLAFMEADSMVGAAHAALARGDLAEGRKGLERAAQLLAAAGRRHEAAQARVAAARVLLLEGNLDAAGALLDQVAGEGDRAEIATARAELATRRAAATADPARAAAAIEAALEEIAAHGQPGELAALLVYRAGYLWRAGEAGRAEADLDRTEGLAADEPAVRSAVALQRATLALAGGDSDAAAAFARDARVAAVEASDPLAYAGAAVLLAEALERGGRDVDAYDALVRAKVSLRDLVGPSGEELVAPALRVFEERLGARAGEVRESWIARRRQIKAQRSGQ